MRVPSVHSARRFPAGPDPPWHDEAVEYEGERWVQRLRDGVVPPRTALLLTSAALLVAGVALVVAELSSASFLQAAADSRRWGVVVLVPPALVVAGPVLAVWALVAGRQDRRLVARIRGRSAPRFFVPVETSTLVAADTLPRPRPVVWSVDDAGLHGWAPGRPEAVLDVVWDRVRDIDLATVWNRGRRQDYGIWLALDHGHHVVLAPRSALGNPVGASAYRRDVVMRILRSLRRAQATSAERASDVS